MKFTIIGCLSALLMGISCTAPVETESPEVYSVVQPMRVDTLYEAGYVAEILAKRNVEIRTRIKGFIDEIHVDEGQLVQAGQVLFTLSAKVYQQELQKAQAITKSALAELKLAEIELANVRRLYDSQIVSKVELDLAQARVEAMSARVDEARSGESQSQLNISLTQIRAPFSGMINRIPLKAGSYADEGVVLTTLSDINEVYAYFHLSESDYLEYITEEDSSSKVVELTLANHEKYNKPGIIEIVESEFDQATGNIAIRARFPNPEKLLKHGSNGKITLKRHLRNAILVPQRSTFELQDMIYVFKLKADSTVEQVPITVSMRIPHFFVIAGGTGPNDTLIYEGVQSLKNGDRIIPKYIPVPREQ